MKKRIVSIVLAAMAALTPAANISASNGEFLTEDGKITETLSSENELSEEEIRQMEEPYQYILKMQEEAKKNPTAILSNALNNEELELSEEELASYQDSKAYEEELWAEIDAELEKRSINREEKEPVSQSVEKKTKQQYAYQDVLYPSKESLTTKQKKKVKQAVAHSNENAAETAEAVNALTGDAFYAAVREVLDAYYADEQNIDEEKIAEFAETIDTSAAELLESYEKALEERQNADNLEYETETVLVTFEEGTAFTDMQEIANCLGGELDILDGTNKELSDYMANGTSLEDEKLIVKYDIGVGQTVEAAKEILESVEGVYGVDENAYIETASASTTTTNDTYYAEGKEQYAREQTYLKQINVDEAWNAIANSLGYCDYETNHATIAIIDTGFDVSHYDLKNTLSEKSITVGETDSNGNYKSLFNCETPYYGDHGSHVAGIIAAETNNNLGIMGITNIYDAENKKSLHTCEVIGINAGIGMEKFSSVNVVNAIYYAVNCGADVINMSMGTLTFSEASVWDTPIQYAHKQNVVIVASAGNNNVNLSYYPASFDNVISVAALNTDGITKRTTSNYGDTLDISAPGTDIYSCFVGNNIDIKSGTSMAAPMVSAAVGMMRAVNKDLTPEEIEKILYATATDLDSSGWDKYTGYGRLNLGAAVQKAKLLKFAETYTQVSYSGNCYYNNSSYSIYGLFDMNPVVDKYIVYRATNSGTLGTQVAELTRNQLIKSSNSMQFAEWALEKGTYYYNVAGVILNGDEIISNRLILSVYTKLPFKVECNASDTLYMYLLSAYPNSLAIQYNGEYDKFIVTRAENYNISQNTSSYTIYKKTFADTTGLSGKLYYYRTKVVRTTDSITYYFPISNTVSMTIQ